MNIYVEDILFSNSVINYLLLRQVRRFFAIKNNNIIIFIASFIGAIFSLFYPLLKLNIFWLLIIKILVMVLIVNIAFIKEKKKNIVFIAVSFLVYSFAFSGFTEFLGVTNINAVWLILPFSVMNYVVTVIVNIIKSKLRKSGYMYNTDFVLNGKTIRAVSFMDSGNSVKYKGKNLMIVSLGFILKFYPEYMRSHSLKFPFEISGCVEFESVNTKGKMYITKFEKIVIYNEKEKHIFNDIEVGINLNNFENYDMLFSMENLS